MVYKCLGICPLEQQTCWKKVGQTSTAKPPYSKCYDAPKERFFCYLLLTRARKWGPESRDSSQIHRKGVSLEMSFSKKKERRKTEVKLLNYF